MYGEIWPDPDDIFEGEGASVWYLISQTVVEILCRPL